MLFSLLLAGTLSFTGGDLPEEKTTADTIRLKEVVVSSKLKRYSSGLSLNTISPTEIKQSKGLLLSDMLTGQSNITINSYGPGATSTVSLRGLSAAHTAVLWNGINLQSSMNGGVNFGNIPAFFVDQIVVQNGGNGALFGSGAIGGVIHLDNSLPFGEGHSGELFQSVGSYGLSYTAAKHTYSGQKVAISSRVFYTESQNGYRYRNGDNKTAHQINANYRKAGIMETAAFTLSGNDKLVVSLWGQDAYNRYPPTMDLLTSKQHDYTSFTKATAQWQATRKRIDFNIKSALFNDWQAYRDPNASTTNSDHQSTVAQIEAEAIMRLTANQSIEGGVIANYERVKSTNYTDIKERFKPAITLAYRYRTDNAGFEAFASSRLEAINGKTAPVTWTAGAQKRIAKGLYLRGNLSRNYRIPSFNDLYWAGGGNPNLVPEDGYGEEVNLNYVYAQSGFLLSAKVAAFNNNVNNWIIWLPNSDPTKPAGSWSPENYKKVWSRGVEGSITIKKKFDKLIVGIDLSGTETITTDEKSTSAAKKGLQLTYVPRYKGSASAYIDYRSLRIKYAQSYTGRRFFKDDRTEWLNPYTLAALSAEKRFTLNQYEVRGFLRIDNLWNESYQIVKNYGLPLLTFQLGVVLQIGSKDK